MSDDSRLDIEVTSISHISGLCLVDVSALSDARKVKACGDMRAVRAFDKAVRRKPFAFAADAVGLWELHVGRSGERVPVVERVEQSGGSPVSRGGCIDDEACEVTSGSGARHKSAWRDGAREVFEMGLRLHAAENRRRLRIGTAQTPLASPVLRVIGNSEPNSNASQALH